MLSLGKLIARAAAGLVGGASRGVRTAGAVATLAAGQASLSSTLAAASFPARETLAGLTKSLAAGTRASSQVASASVEVTSGAAQVASVPVSAASVTLMYYVPSLKGGGSSSGDPFAGMNLPPPSGNPTSK